MTINILPSALRDLEDCYGFYEDQEAGAGNYFMDRIVAEIRSLNVTGGTHRIVGGYHRYVSYRFPHEVFYRQQADLINVYAVVDGRRDPEWIRQHLNR
jgi:plasmid stabilization system protein ParE